MILQGARTAVTDPRPTASSMPSYDWKLSDNDVAAVATYVRNAWGNAAPNVTADEVKSLRQHSEGNHAMNIMRVNAELPPHYSSISETNVTPSPMIASDSTCP